MASINAVSCLHGFAIQGNFEPQRRNYTRVWDMLRVHIARGHLPTKPPLPPLHLHLVGRGLVDMLNLPEGVKFLTTVHFNERYPEYYERVSNSTALRRRGQERGRRGSQGWSLPSCCTQALAWLGGGQQLPIWPADGRQAPRRAPSLQAGQGAASPAPLQPPC